ncbi:MAG: DegT/DnrJ/EryC1/StrS family aminotransferase [bacterium]|nr:DegT/DnrJ/EryC1/StrS family aminotransferase [bacterium]
MIPLSRPDIGPAEKKAVRQVLESPFLSLGPKLKEFEEKFASFASRKYAVGVNSGTSGLHLIIRALRIGKGDEVITTPFSFIASANCMLYEGAKPVFVDIDETTLNIDVSKIERKITKKTKAILAVDVFGYPANWKDLVSLAKAKKLKLIEDSAEAVGSTYQGKPCGSFGDAAIYSFYPNKQMTTGEGGVVLTNDRHIAELVDSMRNQGRRVQGGAWLEHVRLGYNYRLPEIECALGIAQLKRLPEILKKRSAAAALYTKKLQHVPGIEPVPSFAQRMEKSWFVYVGLLSKEYTRKQRDKLILLMARQGIQCSSYFQTIHLQPFYREMFGYKPGSFPVAESVSERTIALPFFTNITEQQIERVVRGLRASLQKVS